MLPVLRLLIKYYHYLLHQSSDAHVGRSFLFLDRNERPSTGRHHRQSRLPVLLLDLPDRTVDMGQQHPGPH